MPVGDSKPVETISIGTIAGKGIIWTGLAQIASQFLTLTSTVILARFLTPSDFGIITIANVVIGGVSIVNDLGLGAAVIQKSDIENKHLNTVFVSNFLLGVILFILLWMISPLASSFYNDSRLSVILPVLGINFLFGGVSATHSVILRKKMQYKSIAVIAVTSTFLNVIAAIILVLMHFGLWAIVLGQLVGEVTSAIGNWVLVGWWPRLQFDKQSFRDLFNFGVNVLGSRIIGYTSANIDYLITGKFLGTSPLGYYNIAYRLASLPRQKFLGVVNQVMFPVFSAIYDDSTRLRNGYIKLLGYISLVTFPLLIGLIFIAPQLIPLLYTEQWRPAIVPLQILCLGGMISTIGSPIGLVLRAKGKPDIEFRMTIVSLLLLTILLLIGAQFELIGIATAVSVKSLVLVWIFGAITNKLVGLKFTAYVEVFIPAAKATLVMAISLLAVQSWLNTWEGLGYLLHIVIVTFIGVVVYLLSMKLLNPHQWSEFVRFLTSLLPDFFLSNKIFSLAIKIIS